MAIAKPAPTLYFRPAPHGHDQRDAQDEGVCFPIWLEGGAFANAQPLTGVHAWYQVL